MHICQCPGSIQILRRKVPENGIPPTWDRISIAVPKGQKDVMKAHAEAQSESVNSFINRAIEETMERDKAVSGSTQSVYKEE